MKDFINYFSPFHIKQSGYKVSVDTESGRGQGVMVQMRPFNFPLYPILGTFVLLEVSAVSCFSKYAQENVHGAEPDSGQRQKLGCGSLPRVRWEAGICRVGQSPGWRV